MQMDRLNDQPTDEIQAENIYGALNIDHIKSCIYNWFLKYICVKPQDDGQTKWYQYFERF